MAESEKTRKGGSGTAAPSSGSLKLHGDKLAGADAASGGRRSAGESHSPDDALPEGDSPKPHGDKLAKAVQDAASSPTHGRRSDQGGR